MLEFQPTTFGDYILQDRIGAGGMAEIFLATAQGIEGFEKRLVIKRILPTLSDDEQFVRMFVEEAKLCVSLHHPNIVQVYDLGLIEGQYYIAMEYVDGRDLLKTLAACGRQKIGFPTDIALYIVMEVLKGLDYAHGLTKDGQPLGIIHRDVSPSNVLLSFEGEVKLGDFGIAKASTRERTATGILKGKFGYMAPEQVTGVPIDFKADIFAVGILLYELLTGHRLFAGKNDLVVLERVRSADINPPPRHYRKDLDYELEHIVLKALARDPAERFSTCLELHDAIHDYVFRSRATVGPNQLARFLQALFLTDPEEQARRLRVRLPPIPGTQRPAAPTVDFAPGETNDEHDQFHDATDEERAARDNSSITEGRERETSAVNDDSPAKSSLALEDGFAPSEIVERAAPSLPSAVHDEPETAELEPPIPEDELDQTVLNHDRKELMEHLLGPTGSDDPAATRSESAPYGEPPPRAVSSPSEPTGVALPPTIPDEPMPEDSPFFERTIAGVNHPDLVGDPEADSEAPTAAPRGPSEELTRRSPTAALPIGQMNADAAANADGDDAPVEDPEPWGDQTVPYPDEVDEVTSGSSATAPDVVGDEATVAGSLRDGMFDMHPNAFAAAASSSPGRARRRRFSTNSVVLYGEERPESVTADVPFEAEHEASVPAITDAGRLGDDGASGLFGALSVLDDTPGFDFDDESSAIDTLGHLRPEPDPVSVQVRSVGPRSSDGEQRVESGKTRMGILAMSDDEPTQSVQDAQVMSLSQEVLSALPEPEAHSVKAPAPPTLSGLHLEFNDEDVPDPSVPTVNENEERKRPFRDPASAAPIQHEASTDHAPSKTDAVPVVSLDSGLQWPSSERGPKSAGLVSESFELGRDNDTPDAPVRPVSMVDAPQGVDDTPNRLPDAPGFLPPRGPAALRAVVGRKSRVKELNRTLGRDADAARPTPILPNPVRAQPSQPVAVRARGSRGEQRPGYGPPNRASPSAGLWSGGTPSAPPAFVVFSPRSPWLTAAVYGLPLLAVLLTVAALVSAVLQEGSEPEPPLDRIVRAPEETPPLPAPPVTPTESAPVEAPPPASAFAPPPTLAPHQAADSPDAESEKSAPPAVDFAPAETEAAEPDEPTRPSAPPANDSPQTKASKKKPLGRVRVHCDVPAIVRIEGVGVYRAAPRFVRRLPPGEYKIKLSRRGRSLDKLDIALADGQTVEVPCP